MLKTFIISTIKVILPVANGKFFQHRLIYFIHTNAMNSFSKLTNGEKVMHSRYKLLILLRQIMHQYGNLSASLSLRPVQNEKIFQQD